MKCENCGEPVRGSWNSLTREDLRELLDLFGIFPLCVKCVRFFNGWEVKSGEVLHPGSLSDEG